MTFLFIWFVVFGLMVGSFLNVVIYRLPKEDMSIIWPGSHCPNCQTPLTWRDNIPVLSYLLLFQKCRTCREYISPRYPCVEIFTGLIFAWTCWVPLMRMGEANFPLLIAQLAFASSLIATSFIDYDLRIIPNEISKRGTVAAIAASFLVPAMHEPIPGLGRVAPFLAGEHLQSLAASCTGALLGYGIVWFIGVFGKFLMRREAMGGGDVKLLAFIGAMLGWKAVLTTLMIATFTGSVIGLPRKLITKDSAIPFGPFLAIGAFLSMLYQPLIWSFMTVSYPRWIQTKLAIILF